MNAQRFWRGFGVVIATMLVGAAAAAAVSFTEPDGHEATARVLHDEARAVDESLAESPRVARDALRRAGAVSSSAEPLADNSDVRVEDGATVAFTVRAGRAAPARRAATSYAEAYRSALPSGDRAGARLEPAGSAERTRDPGAAAPVGALIGLIAGLLLAVARDTVARRRDPGEPPSEEEEQASEEQPAAEEEPAPEPELPPEPRPASGVAAAESENGKPPEEPRAGPLIDLHCHILPGIDDGPRNFAESVELASILVAGGVEVVAATPHVRADHPGVVPDELSARCADLQERLDHEEVPLRVVPGGEVDLRWGLAASGDDLHLVSYAQRGTDLLVETPYSPLTSTFEDELFDLSAAGFRILLAHPERNRTFQDDPERLEELIARGTLVQVTAGSLVRPRRRSRSARLARHLLERGLVHVLASDSHGPRQFARASMRSAVEAAGGLEDGRVQWMASGAPAAILAGESLPSPPPVSPARRPLRDRLRI